MHDARSLVANTPFRRRPSLKWYCWESRIAMLQLALSNNLLVSGVIGGLDTSPSRMTTYLLYVINTVHNRDQ